MKTNQAQSSVKAQSRRSLIVAVICILAVIFCGRCPAFFYWYNIGPQPINTLDNNHNIVEQDSGRVAALAVDPSNANHWLIGAAQGGIWETSDAGNSWNPRTDAQASMSMGAIAFAPANPSLVYAGTGEPNFRGDDYAGAGLLVSHDGGTLWQMLNASFAKTSFSHIRVNPLNSSNLVVATVRGGGGIGEQSSGHGNVPGAPPRGVFVSTDGGASFTRKLTGEATALVANPNNFSQQYSGLGEIYGDPTNGVYRTTDGWLTAQLIPGPWNQGGRITMAGSPSNPNVLYVGVADTRAYYIADLDGIWVTTNAWAATPAWTQLPFPPVEEDFVSTPRFWYMFDLLVDPADPAVVYLAEFDVWRYASGSWTSLADWSNNIHPDNHVMAWVPKGGSLYRMLLGNDGGVYLSDTGVSGSWTTLNPHLTITQFYKGAVDPTGANVLALGGAQDNFTSEYTGSTGWPAVFGGDGGDCAISAANPLNNWVVTFDTGTDNHDFANEVSMLRTLNGGLDFNWSADDISDGLPFSSQFFVHFEKAPYNDDLLIAGTATLWRCNNYFSGTTPSWSANSPTMLDTNGAPVPISAMAFAPSDTSGLIYAYGTEDGQLRITSNGGGTWINPDPAAVLPGRYISGLAFSPNNANTLYVTFSGFNEGTPGYSGHLFKTANAFASPPTWVDVSPPVDLPNNCVAIDPNNAANIYVGTDIGVWNTGDGGVSWTHYGPSSGMPNVAVYDLRFNEASKLTAFTHGRGAYVFTAFNIPIIGGSARSLHPYFGCLTCPPDQFWFNPGDLETVGIPLQGILPVDTVDLKATLLPSAGVTPITGTQDYGQLIGQGASVSRTFQFVAGVSGGPGLAGDACGDTEQLVFQLSDQGVNLGQVTIPFRLGTPSHPLVEDFEELPPPELPPGWSSMVSGTGVPWMTTSNQPPSLPGTGEDDSAGPPPNTSAMVPDVPGESFLLSPPFLIATPTAQLYFRQAFGVADVADGLVLEIAIGSLPFVDILQAGGSFVQAGYNSVISTPLAERAAWSGSSGGWIPVIVNLPPAAAGQPVQLRWHFIGTQGLATGAWFIDSVYITEPLCLPPVSNPVIINPAVIGGFFTFAINTVAGRNYVIEYKTNLTEVAWLTLQTLPGNGSQQIISVPIGSDSKRFYRFHLQ